MFMKRGLAVLSTLYMLYLTYFNICVHFNMSCQRKSLQLASKFRIILHTYHIYNQEQYRY